MITHRNGLRGGSQASASREDDDFFAFNLLTDGPVRRNLGGGDDMVLVRTPNEIAQIRLTISRAEVGNGNAKESGTVPGQDGKLAVRLQAEDATGATMGPVSRFDDEGITFVAGPNVTFDIRDVTGLLSGDHFHVATLGTAHNDIYDYSDGSLNYYIHGGFGHDRLIGGRGNDHPVGGPGNDLLRGGAGDDLLVGGFGNDRVRGDSGNDRAVFNLATDGADLTNLGGGSDTVVLLGGPGQIRFTFSRTEAGNGSARDSNTMANQDGGLAVRIQAESAGGDPVGPTSRWDDEGISFIAPAGATFDIRDLVTGLESGSHYQIIRLGTRGADVIDDGSGNLSVYLSGGLGDDALRGGTANDHLVGGAGNDTLEGGGGDDFLVGNFGIDTFLYSGDPGNDTIALFASGEDLIDLSAFGISIADVQTSAVGANALIEVDSDGQGGFDFQILLLNAAPPAASDFVF